MELNFPKWVRQYRGLTFAYAFLVLLIALGFLRFEMLADEVAIEGARRANLLCEQNNRNRQLTLDILMVTDPEYVEEFRSRLQPLTCPPDPDDAELLDEQDAAVFR